MAEELPMFEGTWDRLRWARKRKFDTAKDFAVRAGVKPGTYQAYERRPDSSKHIALDHQNAMRLARLLKVRWEWLLLGEGGPIPGDSPRDRVNALLDDASPEDQERAASIIESFLRKTA
jgi:transcriptional regulator with XRE-family HTH domain